MQGRLLPKYQGMYQAHPIGYWQEEFKIAKQLGLDCIEFILDYDKFETNPLLNFSGLKEIKKIVHTTDVKVLSVCADYFMKAPIHSDNSDIVDKSIIILDRLIKMAPIINVSNIIIPCVDQSSLKNKNDIKNFINNIKFAVKTAEAEGVNICLETDLQPKTFADMLDSIGSKNITVNYDIGNSAALGFDPIDEFRAYGEKITDVHIKDRKFNGGSVKLGTGNANFNKVFHLLSEYEYQGIMIFQAYRDDKGVDIFKSQQSWLYKKFNIKTNEK